MIDLRRHHGIRLSKRFLEKLPQRVGEFRLHRDDRETAKSLTEKVVPFGEVE